MSENKHTVKLDMYQREQSIQLQEAIADDESNRIELCDKYVVLSDNYDALKARNAELEAIVKRIANNKSGELIVYNNLRAEARGAVAKETEPNP